MPLCPNGDLLPQVSLSRPPPDLILLPQPSLKRLGKDLGSFSPQFRVPQTPNCLYLPHGAHLSHLQRALEFLQDRREIGRKEMMLY